MRELNDTTDRILSKHKGISFVKQQMLQSSHGFLSQDSRQQVHNQGNLHKGLLNEDSADRQRQYGDDSFKLMANISLKQSQITAVVSTSN